jgi:hypothetical protein
MDQFKKDGACRFHITNPLPFQNGFWSIALRKDSQFTSTIDKAYVHFLFLSSADLFLIILITLQLVG